MRTPLGSLHRFITGFVPTVGNLNGFAVLPPEGGVGCGADITACYPLFFANAEAHVRSLQLAYASPAALSKHDMFSPLSSVVVDKMAAALHQFTEASHEVNAALQSARVAAIAAVLPQAQAVGTAGAAGALYKAGVISSAAGAVQEGAQAVTRKADIALQAAAESLRVLVGE